MIRFERDGDGYRVTINIVALVKRAAWFGGSRLSRLATLPDDPPTDARGLPMEMVFYNPRHA